jgi:DHA1 family bicyclomycin/chloramphenicol resistance-like MFS transporter
VPATIQPAAHGRLLLLLGILTAISPLSIDMYLPAFPAIARDLSAGPGTMERTLAVFFVGLSIGQLAYGPISDRVGRRGPLLVGLAVYTLASIGCAVAGSAAALIGLRLAAALGGCAALVIARAVVRDCFEARDAARVFSRLMLIMGVAPILAPLGGSALLAGFGWRAIFWVLAAFGAACIAGVLHVLPETRPAGAALSPPGRDALAGAARAYLRLLRHAGFVGYALAGGSAIAGMFAYIAGSPVVFIEGYGLAPGRYALLFGTNAGALIAASQLNRRVLGGTPLTAILQRAILVTAGAAAALLVAALTGPWPWPVVAACLFVYVGSLGFVGPNATALALADQGREAGTASALLGAIQFGVATLAGTAVGVGHDGTARPLAVVMTVCGLVALAAVRFGERHSHA